MDEKTRFQVKAYEVGTELLEYVGLFFPTLLMLLFIWIMGKL